MVPTPRPSLAHVERSNLTGQEAGTIRAAASTPFTVGLDTHLEFIHDLANGFATGANDPGMNTVV